MVEITWSYFFPPPHIYKKKQHIFVNVHMCIYHFICEDWPVGKVIYKCLICWLQVKKILCCWCNFAYWNIFQALSSVLGTYFIIRIITKMLWYHRLMYLSLQLLKHSLESLTFNVQLNHKYFLSRKIWKKQSVLKHT